MDAIAVIKAGAPGAAVYDETGERSGPAAQRRIALEAAWAC
jgi:hypothetical protein